MAMSGMGMMAGMAAGQALVSALMGGGSGAVGGMMGAGMPGRGMKGAASMGGSSILSGLLGNSGSGMIFPAFRPGRSRLCLLHLFQSCRDAAATGPLG